jgi:hypothetical protein
MSAIRSDHLRKRLGLLLSVGSKYVLESRRKDAKDAMKNLAILAFAVKKLPVSPNNTRQGDYPKER